MPPHDSPLHPFLRLMRVCSCACSAACRANPEPGGVVPVTCWVPRSPLLGPKEAPAPQPLDLCDAYARTPSTCTRTELALSLSLHVPF